MGNDSCRNCGREIRYSAVGAWVHRPSGSVFCDASATIKATPKNRQTIAKVGV